MAVRRIPGHKHAGKLRCAKCEHIWKPKKQPPQIQPCVNCGEQDDVFCADDGGWERAEKERAEDNERASRRWGV